VSATKRENRRVNRIILNNPLRVVLSSLGDGVKYETVTRNISITGFFLDFEKPTRFPFTPASILEIWLELEKGNTIFFNGKMARVVKQTDEAASDTGPGIGVKIVQIDKENEASLKEFITRKTIESERKAGDVA